MTRDGLFRVVTLTFAQNFIISLHMLSFSISAIRSGMIFLLCCRAALTCSFVHPLPPEAFIRIAKVGFGRMPALYPAGAESRLVEMALKLSEMV